MEKIPDLELVRQAFLLTLCERSTVDVSRLYLAEKVNAIYRARHAHEIIALLDPESQRIYRRIVAGLHGPRSTGA